jgi:hypothetical protein
MRVDIATESSTEIHFIEIKRGFQRASFFSDATKLIEIMKLKNPRKKPYMYLASCHGNADKGWGSRRKTEEHIRPMASRYCQELSDTNDWLVLSPPLIGQRTVVKLCPALGQSGYTSFCGIVVVGSLKLSMRS